MKKVVLLLAIIFTATFSFAQTSYQQRFVNANKDSIRTQIRMAVLDNATAVVDTATNKNLRLCNLVLREPTSSVWVDMFVYQLVVTLATSTPTDNQVRTIVLAIWNRVANINTTR